MKQKVLSILALLLMAVTGAMAEPITVTWSSSNGSFDNRVGYSEGPRHVMVGMDFFTGNDIYEWELGENGTFTTSLGHFTKIEISGGYVELNGSTGWDGRTWTGNASSVYMANRVTSGQGKDNFTITFTIEPDPTYIVAGNYPEIFGNPWDGTYEANKMTKGGDGKYTKTYNVEDAFSDIELKVVKDGQDWIGDETGFNVTFSMKQAGSFTVTLDPNANPVYVTVTGDNVVFANTEYAINYATGMQNGTVTGPDTAKEDDEVTLTITPAAGYVLESISVTGVTTENAVEVTDGKFTMPAEDVNVIATFKSVTYAIFAIDTDGTTQDFGSVEAGATAQKTFTITNSGNKSLYVTISNPEDFTAEMTQNANLYFTDALDWGDIHVYYWPNGPEWPGAAMTELYTNELGQKVYCYELPADVEGVIFNGNGNETGDINEPIGKAYYTMDEKVGNKYTVGTWSYDNCVPAGMSRVLTVTMNTATLGSKSGNITLSFDAKNATSFTIPCAGEVVAPVPNSIIINGTPQVGDKSISLTYYFNPANIPGLESFAPTLKVKCAADNKWDEIWLSLHDVSSGTTDISLDNLGEFEAGKTYEVCFAYYNGSWVDEVFQSFVPAAPATTYSITVKEGTEDAANWTVSPNPAEAGQTVTISYTGTKKVKSIKAVKKAVAPAATDLSTISADYEAKDGETLTGTLANNVKISIADGATVTLKDVNITNLGDNCDWAGINCPGDATLVLAGTNTVCAGRDGDGYNNYPGIYIAPDKTLTIQGDGTLTAYSNASKPYGAGIGGGYSIPCGNIVINSGNITATGGGGAAGIGGRSDSCGNITINGGTVEATGGVNGAGIGGGGYNTCGTITISGGTVTATGGESAAGIGSGKQGSCGAITISSGTVTATAVKWAAGIGGGSHNGSCGTITITSGVTQVTATKGSNCLNSIGSGDGGEDITVIIEDYDKVIQN